VANADPADDLADATVTYRLATALAGRLVGLAVLGVAALVLLATVVSAVAGLPSQVTPTVAAVGLLAAAALAWWLFRMAWVVRLTPEGYAVRLLRAPGAATAAWPAVTEAVAASPRGINCLVLRLDDGRTTVIPVPALAADPDVFAHDVRRRLRNAHSSDPDSAAEPESL
jgi:hypothetical protein